MEQVNEIIVIESDNDETVVFSSESAHLSDIEDSDDTDIENRCDEEESEFEQVAFYRGMARRYSRIIDRLMYDMRTSRPIPERIYAPSSPVYTNYISPILAPLPPPPGFFPHIYTTQSSVYSRPGTAALTSPICYMPCNQLLPPPGTSINCRPSTPEPLPSTSACCNICTYGTPVPSPAPAAVTVPAPSPAPAAVTVNVMRPLLPEDREVLLDEMELVDVVHQSDAYNAIQSDEEENNLPLPHCINCLKRSPRFVYECGHACYCKTCTQRLEYRYEVENDVRALDCPLCNKSECYFPIYY